MSNKPVSGFTLTGTACLLAFGVQFVAAAADGEASFAVFGDHGYIPSYEQLDDDEPPLRTLGEYLALEAEDWLEAGGVRSAPGLPRSRQSRKND